MAGPNARVRVSSPTGLGYRTSVEVDGVDISAATRAVTIRSAVNECVTATIDLAVVVGEFDGKALVYIPDATRDALIALGWTPPGALPPFDAETEREHPGTGVIGEGVEHPADGVERELSVGAPS